MGFAPVDNPQIAVAAIVENGQHGGWVAPVVRKLMDYWILEKDKNPIVPPTPEELAKINAEKALHPHAKPKKVVTAPSHGGGD